jgi:hypothetical protein
MGDESIILGGRPVMLSAPTGPRLDSEAAAVDLIGSLWGQEVDWLVLPKARLGRDFLNLRSGLAGAVIQKFVTYGLRVAIVGDISAELDASAALKDFVRESNSGGRVWFVPDLPALEARLLAAG